jgi:predicted metalloprotease with PDZ domain
MKINRVNRNKLLAAGMFILFTCLHAYSGGPENNIASLLQYTISMPEPANHLFHVMLECKNWKGDTMDFKMPQWMPGYYQIMDYCKEVKNFSAVSIDGKDIPVIKVNKNTWRVMPGKIASFSISYDIKADLKFVANSYLDTTHGYIIPAGTFMYINGFMDTPVSLKVIPFNTWNNLATGLDRVEGRVNEFIAPDFDMLYDCPILVGSLDEFPKFTINGIEHRFIAYNPDTFNRELFMASLEKAVTAAVELMGDIPYRQYTFIGIGPGYGGIEHLNNTTVSFSGKDLDKPEARIRTLKFLTHEYFHNYNVKRIRPFELGPFDYNTENRTNLLWFSEGITVYYEYLIVRRASLINDDELLSSIEHDINAFENDSGRHYQSLSQASYNTWSDGPFGDKSAGPDQTISYYEKGPVIGLILDLAIRHATENSKSLDDVMRFLYWRYYKELHRGFTDAEFQQACQHIAGTALSREFEYVNTTRELDYSRYLTWAGLTLTEETDLSTGWRKFNLKKMDQMDPLQSAIFRSWSGD